MLRKFQILVFSILVILLHSGSSTFPRGTKISNSKYTPGLRRPYQVLLDIEQRNLQTGKLYYALCSGAIIDEYWVMTAGHCVEDKKNDPYTPSTLLTVTILVGSDSARPDQYEKHNVYYALPNDIIIHPQYYNDHVDGIIYNDIALLRVHKLYKDLPSSISYRSASPDMIRFYGQPDRMQVDKIQLNEDYWKASPSNMVFVAGWGVEKQNGKMKKTPDHILETSMKIESIEYCKQSNPVKWHTLNPSHHICAESVFQGSKDCSGDSGSPVVDQQRKTVVGIVSFGYPEGCPSTRPSVYTNVATYTPWIKNIIQRHRFCLYNGQC